MARITPDKFVRSLNLLNIEKLYGLRKSVEVTTIDRVLCDESQHLNLRDLPSFYACATGLLSALNYQLETGESRDRLLDEACDFGTGESGQAPAREQQAQDLISSVRSNLSEQSC